MNSTTDDQSGSAVPPFERLRDYRLLCSLGRGGMGEVYLAEHERLERRVAIKVLPPGGGLSEGAIARFEREMKAVGRLHHPHIVQALDAGREGGVHYLVLEYVDGGDLSRVAESVGPLEVADACEAIRQVATGLQHAHENGLVHRDVKPSNMLLGRDGVVKILDLGLALLKGDVPEGELTGTGQIVGTLDYIAPEQIENTSTVDIRADLYSLGCTLYRLLCGRAPFAGERHRTAVAKLRAHVSAEHDSLDATRPGLPNGVVAIVDRLLAKAPGGRFGTPAEVAEALAPFSAGADLATLAERGCPRRPEPADLATSPTVTDMGLAGDPGRTRPVDPSDPAVSEATRIDTASVAATDDTTALPASRELSPAPRTSLIAAIAVVALLIAVGTYLLSGRGTLVVDVPPDAGLVVWIDQSSEPLAAGSTRLPLAAGAHRITIRRDESDVPFDADRGRFVGPHGQVLVFLDDASHDSDRFHLARGVEAHVRFAFLTTEEAEVETERLAMVSRRSALDRQWPLVDEHLAEIERLAAIPPPRAAEALRSVAVAHVNAFGSDPLVNVIDSAVHSGGLECTPEVLTAVLQRVRDEKIRLRKPIPDVLRSDALTRHGEPDEVNLPHEVRELVEQAYGHVEPGGAIVQWLPRSDFESVTTALAARGYELRSLRAFGNTDGVHVSASWVPGKRECVYRFDIERGTFDAVHREQVTAGRRLIGLGGHVVHREGDLVDRFHALWIADEDPPSIQPFVGLTVATHLDMLARFDRNRVIDVSQIFVDATGTARCCSVLREARRGALQQHIRSLTTIPSMVREHRHLGFHEVDLYESKSTIRVSVVFVNPERMGDSQLVYAVPVEELRWLSRLLVRGGYSPTSLSVIARSNGDLVAAGIWSRP